MKVLADESAFRQVEKRMIKENREGAHVMAKDEAFEKFKEQKLRFLMEKPSRGPWKDRARVVVQ